MSSSYASPGTAETHSHGLGHGLGHNPLSHRQHQHQHQQHQQHPYYSGHHAHGYAPIDAVLSSSPYSAVNTAVNAASAITTNTSLSPLSTSTASPPAVSSASASSAMAAVMRAPQPQHMSSSPSPTASTHLAPSSSDPAAPLSSAATTRTTPTTNTGPGTKRRLPRAAATYPRKRATQACLTCRFRRTKCDNARPACAACVRLGADCSYREADHSTLTILNRLDELERLFRQRQNEASTAILAATAAAASLHSNGQTLVATARLNASSPVSQAQSDLSYAVDVWSREKRPQVSIDAVLQWAPFKDEGFKTRMFPTQRNDDSQSPNVNGHTNGCTNGHANAGWRSAIDLDLPAADAVLRSFFDNVHVFNPILEEDDVQDYVKMIRFQGIGWDAVSCLTLLIYALGTVCTMFGRDYSGEVVRPSDFRQSAGFHEAEAYFLAAQKRMGMLLCRSGVIDAQCFFLAGVYLMTTLRPVEAWKMFVQALACCQGFLVPIESAITAAAAAGGGGAAMTSPSAASTTTEDGSNPKRRIYWACYKSELELRLELNPSQKDVWDLTYPTFFPSPPEALKARDETAWYFYLAEIALTRLKNRILSHLYKSDTHATKEANLEYILDFEEQIHAWLHSLPPPLELDSPLDATRDHDQNEAFRFVLNGHLLDCQEIMYWPFVVDAVHGRGSYANSNSSTSSNSFTSFLRKGLRVCVDRIRQSRQGFRHRHHGTWLMLRSSTRSALVLLAVVRCPALAHCLPGGWDESVADVTEMLRLWQDESSDVLEMLTAVETLLSTSP
ncbi:Zcf27p [Sporothrix bragantina]|uniref:Zcf27p n=1 Tax=Sporothrix bragantina TaxID=671064 RepID=A0ABP0AT88_9PEZI